ncbi:hypothetical protein [Pseudoalteromonas luteoviolacea]|uniref:Uncharacterized protein n=1 Tax=Pseudoalteromonas luteoviolacea S4054 TaxID=1129367 RepID=A0A0F6AGL7_9GAMM|nr:hypothetical protein [Pseudoalteromonas luteoviolacea]AOT11195.1 hypothetical protein S4054249_25550 [Pseudoalteromonas luteoviolacea]AOT15641.1 hypothetical protein S40542_22960 [Pseudoalteromonas luteoviolacea]AOT21016.1 hypothetical protein S4054_25470 [Pseudoalteromonas luteoviolacea]KKE84544.1 hypothetical protein N479_08240 [Pseudoalteromonas luteoviolacea S4054]KZN71311.1 hypothetical protein N481_19180 [Pseudoalteromonas luteoviolacea S4047-1]
MKLTPEELKLLREVETGHFDEYDSSAQQTQSIEQLKKRIYQLWLVEPLALYLAHSQCFTNKSYIDSILLGEEAYQNDINEHKITTLLTLINKLPDIVDTSKCPRSWRFYPSPSITFSLIYPKVICSVQSLSLSGACVASFPLNGAEHVKYFTKKHAYLELSDNLHIHVYIERAIARNQDYIALQFNHHTRENPMLKLLILSHYLKSKI